MIVVWARYATEAQAETAARTNRFGPGPWRVERRGSGPFPFCLLWTEAPSGVYPRSTPTEENDGQHDV